MEKYNKSSFIPSVITGTIRSCGKKSKEAICGFFGCRNDSVVFISEGAFESAA
jgi:hypothetical protein